jgi:nitronate monooxygenase
MADHPIIIQGGMGVAVSGWRLAGAVSAEGQLGVVSGTALDTVMVRRLQMGDPGGFVRRALDAFPIPGIVDRIRDRYFIEGGKGPDEPFLRSPMGGLRPTRRLLDLLVVSAFAEVYLARLDHPNPVGINLLEKIQAPILPVLFGAMLAGVGYVLVGAGIPRAIPGILDRLARGEPAKMKADVKQATEEDEAHYRFDPAEYAGGTATRLKRPRFLAIVSSHVLATMLARKNESRVDGFVVEGPTAGGHNAPPRGKPALSDDGEPVYGDRDRADLAVFRELGLPFWLAGSYGRPDRVKEALGEGAAGVQVGTAFAYCHESGLDPVIKSRVIAASREHRTRVYTDPIASPTGFPFKVLDLEGSMSEHQAYANRDRVCDLGYLRTAYVTDSGRHGWRCPAEPTDDYVRKGGDLEDTVGRKCLCNALLANVGLAQRREDGNAEPPLVTSGDDVTEVAGFLAPGASGYSAKDVIGLLVEGIETPQAHGASTRPGKP